MIGGGGGGGRKRERGSKGRSEGGRDGGRGGEGGRKGGREGGIGGGERYCLKVVCPTYSVSSRWTYILTCASPPSRDCRSITILSLSYQKSCLPVVSTARGSVMGRTDDTPPGPTNRPSAAPTASICCGGVTTVCVCVCVCVCVWSYIKHIVCVVT